MKWIAKGGELSIAMDGSSLANDTEGAEIIRIGEVAEALPVSVLPQSGRAVPAMVQEKPSDIVSGWVRVWIAGFLSDRSHWDGVICALHGDLSHWLHISADEVVSCQSTLTPRMIDQFGASAEANPEAVADTMSRPERLAIHLRVADVQGRPQDMTAHLIAAELAATRPYWLGQQIAVISETALGKTYADLIAVQGCPVEKVAVDDVIPKGLAALGTALGLAD